MTSKRKIALLLLATALGSVASHASNDKDDDGACEVSAKIMYRACRNDVRDDYLTTAANCVNISNYSERRACFKEAKALRAEEKEYCEEVEEAREEACEILGEDRYDPDPLLDPGIEFIDPDEVPDIYAPNPFVSVVAGHTYLLKAGEEGEETVVVHVTDDSREILGVECRVVVDVVVEESDEGGGVYEYEAVEVTDDWFAQDSMSNVYYCGEIARNFEDGVLRDLDGSFEAGLDFAKSGVLIRAAFPGLGVAHRRALQEQGADPALARALPVWRPRPEPDRRNAARPQVHHHGRSRTGRPRRGVRVPAESAGRGPAGVRRIPADRGV